MLTSRLRRFARDVQHDLWPTAERAVLRELERRSATEPRRTPGQISIASYDFEYADAISAWPQWDDIFIRSSLSFDTATPQPRILDCGANIGLASLWFKSRYPNARITAFEADPDLAAMCRRNVARDRVSDVEVRAAAVWIGEGTLEFACEGADSGAIASLQPTLTGTRVEVRAERLRDWLNEPIDLLKLDVEGAELPLLNDCRDRLHNIRAMTIDVHEFEPARRQTGAVFDVLASTGFLFEMRDLVSLPWRSASVGSPFSNAAVAWVATIRAWRP